jgi:small-conductance mechanosensitive channel
MVKTLVLDDMHVYVGGLALIFSAYQQNWDAFRITVSAMFLSAVSWWLLKQPMSSLEKRGVDTSIAFYAASLIVWCSLAALIYCLVICAGFQSPEIQHSERMVLVASVALGAGVQPTLTNFAAGLLLVLFRPFRVGDIMTVCGKLFTVQSITAFFTHGTDFDNRHVVIPNNKVIGDVICNWKSNPSTTLDVVVHVRAGQRKTNEVRAALVKAAEAFDARLVGFVDKSAVEEVKAFVDSYPKKEKGAGHVQGPLAFTEKGVLWKVRPRVPNVVVMPAIYLCHECVHDALMDAGIEMFELRSKD